MGLKNKEEIIETNELLKMDNPLIILKNNTSEYFDLIQYPDGQKNIRLHLHEFNTKYPIVIKCRIKNFSELEVLSCLVSALVRNDFFIKSIKFVYLFGIRSDRVFNEGECSYCKDVLAPIINNYPGNLFLLWPFVPLPILFNILNISMYPIFYDAFYCIGGDESANNFFNGITDNYFVKERCCDYDDEDNSYITVKLSQPIPDNVKEVMIVDDLCDGGATFIAEAQYLRKLWPDIKMSLFVYHGLFTKGVEELLLYFDQIICTNSYQDIEHPKVKQIKVI